VRLACVWIAAGLVVAAALPSAAQEDPSIARGRTFARANCAMCHAVEVAGRSPLADAPPFRELSKRLSLDELAPRFAEGIVAKHPSMPQFRLDPDQVENLLAYLKYLQR
jgi:cytochrome c